jgi:prephenate dehydratase
VRVGYLGPPGSFCEEALLQLAPGDGGLDEVPYPTVIDCFDAVRAGEVPAALVPIENSLEGSVNPTLDQLSHGGAIGIRGEVVLPVRQFLVAAGPLEPSAIERVLSHPHATAQCRPWLRANAPQARIVATDSTSDAVRMVGRDEAGPRAAAIGTRRAAELYHGTVIASDIAADEAGDNHTRFVLVASRPAPATGPGRFRTSIICTLERDRPGALLAILQEFALRAVNLSRLESRPTKTGLGSYLFFIDIEGSRDRDLPVAEAIRALEDQGVARVTFLGSYRADGGSG